MQPSRAVETVFALNTRCTMTVEVSLVIARHVTLVGTPVPNGSWGDPFALD